MIYLAQTTPVVFLGLGPRFPGYDARPTGALVLVVRGPNVPGDGIAWPFDAQFPQTMPAADPPPASVLPKELESMRESLGLNLSDFALTLDVSRPTLYAWLRGEVPNRTNRVRIEQLSRIADAWSRARLGPMHGFWSLPADTAGARLKSLLTADDLSVDAFDALLARLVAEQQRPLPPRTTRRLGFGDEPGARHRHPEDLRSIGSEVE